MFVTEAPVLYVKEAAEDVDDFPKTYTLAGDEIAITAVTSFVRELLLRKTAATLAV